MAESRKYWSYVDAHNVTELVLYKQNADIGTLKKTHIYS